MQQKTSHKKQVNFCSSPQHSNSLNLSNSQRKQLESPAFKIDFNQFNYNTQGEFELDKLQINISDQQFQKDMKEYETVKESQKPDIQEYQQNTLNNDLITDQQNPDQFNFELTNKYSKLKNNIQSKQTQKHENAHDTKQHIKQSDQKKLIMNSLKARAFKRDPNAHSQQNLTIETATIGSRTGTASSQQSQIPYQQFIHTQRNSTKNNILFKDNLNYRQSMDVNGFESTFKNDFQDLKKNNQKREMMQMMGKTNSNNFQKYLNKNLGFQNFDQKTSYDYGWNNIIKTDRSKSRTTKNESLKIPSLPLKKLNQFESSLAIIQQKKELGIQSWYSKRLNQEKENQSQLNKNFIKSKLSKSKDKELTRPIQRTQSQVRNKFMTVEDEKLLEKNEEEKSYIITYKLKAQQKVRMTQITDLKIEDKNDHKRTILSASNKRNIALNLPESFALNLIKQSPNKSNVSPQKNIQQTVHQIPQYPAHIQQQSQIQQIKNDYQTLQNIRKLNQNLDKQQTFQGIQSQKNQPLNKLMNKRELMIQQQNYQQTNDQNKSKIIQTIENNNQKSSLKQINIISQELNLLKTPKQYNQNIYKTIQNQNITSVKKLQPISSKGVMNVIRNQSPHKSPQVKVMTSPQYQITAIKKDTKQIVEENEKLRENIEKYDMLDYHTNQNIVKLKKKMELAKSDQIEQYRDLATYEYVYCQYSNIGQNVRQILKYYHETNKTLKMNVKVDREGNAFFTNDKIEQSVFFHDSSDEKEEVKRLNQIQKHVKTILKKIIKLKLSQPQPQHIFSNKFLQQYVDFAKSVGLKKNMMKSLDILRHSQRKQIFGMIDQKRWLHQSSVHAFGQTKSKILNSKMNNNVMKEAMKTINSDGDIMKLVNISGNLCFLSARSINIEIIGIVSKMVSSKKFTFEIRNENFKKQQINMHNEVTKLQFTNKKIKNIDRQIIQSKTQFEEKSKTSNFIIRIRGSYKKYIEVSIQLGAQSKTKNEFLVSFQTRDNDKKIYESIDIFEIQKFFQKNYQLKFQNINYEHVAQYVQDQMIFFQRPNGDIQLLEYETSKKLYVKDLETAFKQKLDSKFNIYLKSIRKNKIIEKQLKISLLQKMQSRMVQSVSGIIENSMKTEQQDQSKKNFGRVLQSIEMKSENSQVQILDIFQNKSQLSRYKFASQIMQNKVVSRNNSLVLDQDVLFIDRNKNQSYLKGNKFEDMQKLFENDVNNYQKLNKRSKSFDFKLQLSQIQMENEEKKLLSLQEKENYIFELKKQYLKLKYQKKRVFKEDIMIDQYELFYGYRLVKSQNKFKKYKEQKEKVVEVLNQKEEERKEIVEDYYKEKTIKQNFKSRASEHLIQNKRRKYFRETKVFQNDYIQQIEQNGSLRHFQAEIDEKDNEFAVLYLFCQEKHENFLLLGRGSAKEFLYIEEQSQLQSESGGESQQNIGLLGAQTIKKKQDYLGNLKTQLMRMKTKVIKDEGNEQLNEISKLNSEIENSNLKPLKRNFSGLKVQEQEKMNFKNEDEVLSQSLEEIESLKDKQSNLNEKEDIVLMQSEKNDNDVDNDSPYRVKITVDIKFLSFLQDPLITCGEELPGNYKNIIANENFQELIRLEVEKMFGGGEQKQEDEAKKQGDGKFQNQSNMEVDKSINEQKLKTFDDQKSFLLKVQSIENKSRQDDRSALERNKNETNQKIYEDDLERILKDFIPDFTFLLTNDY